MCYVLTLAPTLTSLKNTVSWVVKNDGKNIIWSNNLIANAAMFTSDQNTLLLEQYIFWRDDMRPVFYNLYPYVDYLIYKHECNPCQQLIDM